MHHFRLPWILALTALASGAAAQDPRPTSATSSQSWRVTVTGAEIYDGPRGGAEPGEWRRCNLRVDLQLQYLGESGEVNAPQVQITNGDADTSRYVSVSVGFGSGEVLPWLMSGKSRPQTLALTKGQAVGGEKPVSYCFVVLPRRSADPLTRDFGQVRLHFADAPALVLKPTITNKIRGD